VMIGTGCHHGAKRHHVQETMTFCLCLIHEPFRVFRGPRGVITPDRSWTLIPQSPSGVMNHKHNQKNKKRKKVFKIFFLFLFFLFMSD